MQVSLGYLKMSIPITWYSWRQVNQACTEGISTLHFCNEQLANGMSGKWSQFCTVVPRPPQNYEGAIKLFFRVWRSAFGSDNQIGNWDVPANAAEQEGIVKNIEKHRKGVSKRNTLP